MENNMAIDFIAQMGSMEAWISFLTTNFEMLPVTMGSILKYENLLPVAILEEDFSIQVTYLDGSKEKFLLIPRRG